jgi:hypothetical protein
MTELFPSQNLTTRRLLLLGTSLTLGAFGWFLLGDSEHAGAQESAPQALALSAAPVAALAEVDGAAITLAMVENRAAAELARLEDERRAVLERSLEAEIADQLLALEARRRGLSLEQLLELEVHSKVEAGDSSALANRRNDFVAELRAKATVQRNVTTAGNAG